MTGAAVAPTVDGMAKKKPPEPAPVEGAGLPIDRINPDLLALARPISTLKLDPRNARRHPERNLDGIKVSLAENGQQKAIVVRPDGTVVAGNGTLVAARGLGWTKLAAVVFDGTADQARRFALQDNRTAELAEWDKVVLLDEVQLVGADDPELLGFTADELRAMAGLPPIESGSPPVPSLSPPVQFNRLDNNVQTEHQCPRCSYKWSGSSAAPAAAAGAPALPAAKS